LMFLVVFFFPWREINSPCIFFDWLTWGKVSSWRLVISWPVFLIPYYAGRQVKSNRSSWVCFFTWKMSGLGHLVSKCQNCIFW
jgi:hypothetical protein